MPFCIWAVFFFCSKSSKIFRYLCVATHTRVQRARNIRTPRFISFKLVFCCCSGVAVLLSLSKLFHTCAFSFNFSGIILSVSAVYIQSLCMQNIRCFGWFPFRFIPVLALSLLFITGIACIFRYIIQLIDEFAFSIIFFFFLLLFILRFISLASQIALALIECQLCNLSLYWCSRFRFNTFESNWFLTWLLLYGFNHRRIVWISASELNQMNQPIIIISITYVVIEKEFCCWWCSWWGEHPRINSNTHKGCINTEATTFNRHFLTTWHIYEKATTKNIKMIKKTHTSFRTEAAHILEILHILTRVFTEVDMFHKMSTHIPTRYSVAPSFSQFNYIVWKYSAYIEFIWWLS